IALASREGSIDWLCLPRVDSDACFAQLLGRRQHGYWAVRPVAPTRSIERRYRQDTLVLETDYDCDCGRVRMIDFMVAGQDHDLMRIVEGVDGEVAMHSDLVARFGYGKHIPWIRSEGARATLTSGPHALLLESPVPLQHDREDARLEASFVVRAGQRMA